MKVTHHLSTELQLGKQLNHSVNDARRSDFALMLAMLDEDVTSQNQFYFPETTDELPEKNDDYFRKLFSLPEPVKLADKNRISDFNQSALVQKNKMTTIRLSQALKPLPLGLKDNKKFISSSILEDTSIHTQARYQASINEQHSDNRSLSQQKMAFNAAMWLKNIQQSQAMV